jgi:hypothetical protein
LLSQAKAGKFVAHATTGSSPVLFRWAMLALLTRTASMFDICGYDFPARFYTETMQSPHNETLTFQMEEIR